MNRPEHLLIILAEECNEVAHRCSKALRFGLQEVEPGQALTNAQRIYLEYADLQAVFGMLVTEGAMRGCNLDLNELDRVKGKKRTKIERYLDYSRECGTLKET